MSRCRTKFEISQIPAWSPLCWSLEGAGPGIGKSGQVHCIFFRYFQSNNTCVGFMSLKNNVHLWQPLFVEGLYWPQSHMHQVFFSRRAWRDWIPLGGDEGVELLAGKTTWLRSFSKSPNCLSVPSPAPQCPACPVIPIQKLHVSQSPCRAVGNVGVSSLGLPRFWNNTRYFVAGMCWVFFSSLLHLGHSAYNPTISSLKKNKNYLQVTFKTKGEAILNSAIFHFWHLVLPQALQLQIMLVGNGSFYAHLKKEGLYIMNRTRIKKLAV